MPKILTAAKYHKVVTYKNDLGMTNTAIAEALGIQRQTVATILKRDKTTGSPEVQVKGHKKNENGTNTKYRARNKQTQRCNHSFSVQNSASVKKRITPEMLIVDDQKKDEGQSSVREEGSSQVLSYRGRKGETT